MPPPESLLEEIAALLALPAAGDDTAALERMLTDGYARVLALAAERLRLEKQVVRLVASPERASAAARMELAAIALRPEGRADDLSELRALLGRLRRRHSFAPASGP